MRATNLAWIALVVMAMRAAAWAGDGFEPPDIQKARNWYAIVAAVVAALAVCVIAFKNSKRTHLD